MTNLQAINAILAAIGESPIDAIGSGLPQEQAVQTVLYSVHAREAARGWWFNTAAAAPYDAQAVAFEDAPDSYAAYVVALAQVRFVKDYDGDEGKIKFYSAEAMLAASVALADHVRNVTAEMNTTLAAAVSALFAVATEAAGDPITQVQLLLGANRIEKLATKALNEMSTREQAGGWWFNTDADDVVTPIAIDALPDEFLEWITALSAVRVAMALNASDGKVKQLREEAQRAAAVVFTTHLHSVLAERDTTFAAAVSGLIRVAEEVAGGPDMLMRSISLVGANRIDRTIIRALDEVNRREQQHGWWFNTDADTDVITVLPLDDAAVPGSFREWVTSLAALRVAKVFNASQVKQQSLQEEAMAARVRFMQEHIKAARLNLLNTNAVVSAMVNNYGYRYVPR